MNKRSAIIRFLRGWWPEKPKPNAKPLSIYRSLPILATMSTIILLAAFEGGFLPRAPPLPPILGQTPQPALLFQKTWGGTGDDIAYSVATDSSGNVYTTGQTSSFGHSYSALTLLKYNRTGALVWQRTWSGENGTSAGQGVVVDSSGNIYVSGATTNFGTSYDVLLLKFNSTGSLLWQRSWGGTNSDWGFGVALDASGNIYVTGSSASFSAGSDDVLLLKFSPAGSLLWQKTWGGSRSDTGHGVAVDVSGDIYVSGETWSFGAGYNDALFLKFNSTGSLLWQKTWGGSNLDAGYNVAVDSSGNAYFVGTSYGSNYVDSMILKFDSTGSLVWQRTWRGNSANSRLDIALDASGDIFLAGAYSSGMGSSSIALLELSSSASLLWQSTWGGSSPGFDEGFGVAIDAFGNALVTGIVQQGPPYTLGSAGNNTLGTPTLSLGNPSFTLGTPSFTLHTPSGTVQMPSGSESYGGGYDQFLIKYSLPPTITFATNPTAGGSITFNGTSYSNGMAGNYAYGTVPISAHPPAGYDFSSWGETGSIVVANSNSNSTTATITGPGSLTASFTSLSSSPIYTNGILLAGLIVAVSVILVRRRRNTNSTQGLTP